MSVILTHGFSTTSNLCVHTGNLRDEGWMNFSPCPYMQFQVQSLDHRLCTPSWCLIQGPHVIATDSCITVGLTMLFWCYCWLKAAMSSPTSSLKVCPCLHGIEWGAMGCYIHGKDIPQKGNSSEVFLEIGSWQRIPRHPRLEDFGYVSPLSQWQADSNHSKGGPFASWSYAPNERL